MKLHPDGHDQQQYLRIDSIVHGYFQEVVPFELRLLIIVGIVPSKIGKPHPAIVLEDDHLRLKLC